jgi:MFS family permease
MVSNAYRRYVTSLLLVVYVFNQLDRGVFSILLVPIKQQFQLTDTQLGFVWGPALVVLYSCLGVPVARWADRSRRVWIMSGAIVIWSVVTVLTATVQHFWQLALARVAVGVGEAGFSAIAISVIGDYENDQNRARAISTFMLAIPISLMLSDLVGGWVAQWWGWRRVFLMAGLPGIVFAILMRVTVREPARRPMVGSSEVTRPPLKAVLAALWARRSLRHLALAQGLANIVANAIAWVSVFFIRDHGMTTGELGTWLAVAEGVGPFVGIWLSGFLAARFAAKDPAVNARFMAYASLAVAPLALSMLWCPLKGLALLLYLLLNIPAYYFLGPTQALAQELVGPSMRATTASVLILVQLLAGGVIGAQIVGVLSDALTPFAGSTAEALRWAMALGSMFTLWAALHFWLAGKHIRGDLAAVRGEPLPVPSVA